MKVKLTKAVKTLANGAAKPTEDRDALQGVFVTKREAVVADGYMVMVKTLQPVEMDLEPKLDDGVNSVVVPAELFGVCEGEEIFLQTMEAMRLPTAEEKEKGEPPKNKTVVRLDNFCFSVEADAIEGRFPSYQDIFKPSPIVSQVAFSTKQLKKLLKSLPSDGTIKLRITEPDKPVEFQCGDEDGDIPIQGAIMPQNVNWKFTQWRTQLPKEEVKVAE